MAGVDYSSLNDKPTVKVKVDKTSLRFWKHRLRTEAEISISRLVISEAQEVLKKGLFMLY